MSQLRTVVKQSEISEAMFQDVIEMTAEACAKFNLETEIAKHIKMKMDDKYKPMWQCVVGAQYSSYITYELENFVDFEYGDKAILLFKAP
ncbi:unnamed protein product [Dicrocoelium dendriticum]|nr:unnamed protein product [Dicrocoelium dendriticum]